jgi:hypothetical protein
MVSPKATKELSPGGFKTEWLSIAVELPVSAFAG